MKNLTITVTTYKCILIQISNILNQSKIISEKLFDTKQDALNFKKSHSNNNTVCICIRITDSFDINNN